MSNFTTEHGSGGGTSGAAAVGEIIIADSHFANPNYIEVIDGAFLDTTPYPELTATLNNSVSVTKVFGFESTINNPTPASYDHFGYSVSINSTGDRAIIGANGAQAAGSAYIYTRTGTTWTLESTINNPTPAISDYFGNSVSINSTGDRVVIGANLDDTGATDAGSAYILHQFPAGTIKLTDTVYNANDSISPFLRIK